MKVIAQSRTYESVFMFADIDPNQLPKWTKDYNIWELGKKITP